MGGSCSNAHTDHCNRLVSLTQNSETKHSVTGRANVGKSTMLNAVLGQKDLLNTSKKAVSIQVVV
jgi:GTP-binding protein EngB required for normal cell division